MPLYDWACGGGHTFEARAGYDTTVLTCACGLEAGRESVYRINFGGFAATTIGQQDFREDYRRFTEATAYMDYAVSERERNTGEKIEVPLFQAAKKRAAKLAKAGVTADQITT